MAGASKRARGAALEAVVTTESITGLGDVYGMFVLADGTRLFTTSKHTLDLQLPSTGMPATIAGRKEDGFEDGKGADARFASPDGFTVDRAGDIVLSDTNNHALRKVAKAGAAVTTLAGNG
jgi:hypothetical protein